MSFCQLSVLQFITMLATQTLSILVTSSPIGKSQEDKVQLTKISFLLNHLSQAKVLRSVQNPWSTVLSKQTSWQRLGFWMHSVLWHTEKDSPKKSLVHVGKCPRWQVCVSYKACVSFLHSGLLYTSNSTRNMRS